MLELKTALIALAVCAAFNLGTQALAAAGQDPAPASDAKPQDHGTLVIRVPGGQNKDEAAPDGGRTAPAAAREEASAKDGAKDPAYQDGGRASTPDQRMEGALRDPDGASYGRAQGYGRGSWDDGPDQRMLPPPPPGRGMDGSWRGPRDMADARRWGCGCPSFSEDRRMDPPQGRMDDGWRGPADMMDGRMRDGYGQDMGPGRRMGPPGYRMDDDRRAPAGMTYGRMRDGYGQDMGPGRRMGPPPSGDYGVRMLPPAPMR
ncbi:MAG: hypothetical protein ACI4NA_05700 [Succinivibrio sp.]